MPVDFATVLNFFDVERHDSSSVLIPIYSSYVVSGYGASGLFFEWFGVRHFLWHGTGTTNGSPVVYTCVLPTNVFAWIFHDYMAHRMHDHPVQSQTSGTCDEQLPVSRSIIFSNNKAIFAFGGPPICIVGGRVGIPIDATHICNVSH